MKNKPSKDRESPWRNRATVKPHDSSECLALCEHCSKVPFRYSDLKVFSGSGRNSGRNSGRKSGCNGIGFAGHFQTGNGPDYILLRRIYLSTGQLVASSLQTAY